MKGGASRTIHMCIDIRGALECPRHQFDQVFSGCVTKDDGEAISTQEFRDYLYSELMKGRKVVPTTSECEGFDYQTGCPGHPYDPEVSP